MGNNIKVSAALLKTRAEQLTSLNKELRNVSDEFEHRVRSLNDIWEGDASDAFYEAAQLDKRQMDNFAATVDQYCQALIEIAEEYERVELQNFQIASKRTHG